MKLVIFDLDGTLCNTLGDIAASLNRALEASHFPTYSDEDVSRMVGRSISYMCQRAMPKGHENDWPQVQKAYYDDYTRHLADSTVPYAGIIETLYALKERGYSLAVVTNKPHSHAVSLVNQLFPHNGEVFAAIQGQAAKFALKPDPASLLYVLSNLKATVSDCVYVGDSEVDVQFARNCNMAFIGCAWGFRGRKVLEDCGYGTVIDAPEELLKLL